MSQFGSRNFSGPISDAAVPGRLPQIRQRTQLFDVQDDFHMDIESCLALRRGKMIFRSPNMITIHSLMKVVMGSMTEKGMMTADKKPSISDILKKIKFNLFLKNSDEILIHTRYSS